MFHIFHVMLLFIYFQINNIFEMSKFVVLSFYLFRFNFNFSNCSTSVEGNFFCI